MTLKLNATIVVSPSVGNMIRCWQKGHLSGKEDKVLVYFLLIISYYDILNIKPYSS